MENASKALIIAGAILLAIVIISLGLIVVNNTRNTVDTANLNEQEIQAFNAKFTGYEGKNVNAVRINSLIQQVISTNQATADEGGIHFVTICYIPSNWSSVYAAATYYNGGLKVASVVNVVHGSEPTDLLTYTHTNAKTLKAIRDDLDDSKVTSTDQYGWHADLNSSDFSKPVTLSANSKFKYDVKMLYKNGLVKCILCQKVST